MAAATSLRVGGFTQPKVVEILLGLGFLSLTLGMSLVQFVIIGLLGVPLVLVGLTLLIVAGSLLRSPNAWTVQSWLGIALFVLGLLLLIGTTGQALTVAYERARFAMQPHAS
jgi:hypothetical protein